MFAIAGCANTALHAQIPVEDDLTSVIVAEIAASRGDLPDAARYYAGVAARSASPELLERATRVAAQAQQPRLALRGAERWSAQAPGNADAYVLAGIAALQLYQIEASARYLARVVSLQSANPEAGLTRVDEALSESDDPYAARRVAERLVAPYPDSAAALRLLAEARLNADDASGAVPVLRHVWQLAPRPESGWALARALAVAGSERESMDLTNRLADQADAAGHMQQAEVLVLLRHEGAARAVLESLLDSGSQGADALQMLAQMLLRQGDLDAAEDCLLRLIKGGHHVDDAFFDLGRIAEQRGREEEALRLYARVNEGRRSLSAMLRAAALLHRRGMSRETDELFAGLLTDVPARAPQIIAAHAQLYAQSGEAARGLDLVQRGLADYPDSTELQFKRAELLDLTRQLRAALHAFEDLQRRRPDDPAALNALGYTLADHAIELPRARRLIERALAQAPQSIAIRDSLGWVLFRQGQPAQALPHLEAAFEMDRGAETGAHLGEVLWALNRREEARRVWVQARLDDPRDPVLLATLRRLGAEH